MGGTNPKHRLKITRSEWGESEATYNVMSQLEWNMPEPLRALRYLPIYDVARMLELPLRQGGEDKYIVYSREKLGLSHDIYLDTTTNGWGILHNKDHPPYEINKVRSIIDLVRFIEPNLGFKEAAELLIKQLPNLKYGAQC